ncbi:caspase domain-containing protein [Mycena leptocephala]|nr:caspase domain-containing protein [Mycena leptocephala]
MSSTSLALWSPHPGTPDLRLASHSLQYECVPFSPRGPGSTLHRFYSAGGQFLEEHANRVAYKLGKGPHAVCQRIQAFFGDGPEREAKLDELKHGEVPLVKKWCLRLMKYLLPSESASTQLQASKALIMLITRYPGLRCLFCRCKHIQSVEFSDENIVALWDPSGERTTSDVKTLNFLRFAAACVADADIAPMLEDTPPMLEDTSPLLEETPPLLEDTPPILEATSRPLWCCTDPTAPLSIIERLLVASDCNGASPFSSLISVRYLGGILELPSFWSQAGTMLESVVQKILLRTTVILRDLGVDSREEIETLSSDTEGIDILCAAVLAGVEGWLVGRQADELRAEYWYQEFRQVITLLRQPQAEEILPRSWISATTGLLKAMIPSVYRPEVVSSLVLEQVVAFGQSETPPLTRPEETSVSSIETPPLARPEETNVSSIETPPLTRPEETSVSSIETPLLTRPEETRASSTANSQPAHDGCPVFALIIGINKACDLNAYKALPGLKGCVNDAKDFQDFLKKSLHVPDSHIKLIINEDATRANILDAFKTHLINNTDIRAGGDDAIIFFYAGYGSRVAASNSRYSTDGKVETICPHDEDIIEKSGAIPGIPDYVVHSLLQQVAFVKGNNVTAIFDSCNLGDNGRNKLNGRYFESTVAIPADSDSELIHAGSSTLPPGFRNRFMESHVLLAACRDDQIATEILINNIWRGRFTESLVYALRNITLEKTTYLDLMEFVRRWTEQDPQVEGKHKDRFLFDGKYPPIRKKALPLTEFEIKEPIEGRSHVTSSSKSFVIEMGNIGGVVNGTEFLVRDNDNNTICFLSAHAVDLNHSILVNAKDKNETLPEIPDGSTVTVSDWKNDGMIMKIYLANDVNPSITSVLFPQRHLDSPQLRSLPTSRKFVQADSQTDADIELKGPSPNGVFVVERLRGIIKDHAPAAAKFVLTADKYYRLPDIMDAIAQFNYLLRRGTERLTKVMLEMHNIFVEKIAKVERNKYGFTLSNGSEYDLFPFVFYFDPAEYVIQEWYVPHSPIGYGFGRYAFEFDLPPGKTNDTGFLQVFVSTRTKPPDMGWIEQKSPFKPDFAPFGRLSGRLVQTWNVFQATKSMAKGGIVLSDGSVRFSSVQRHFFRTLNLNFCSGSDIC